MKLPEYDSLCGLEICLEDGGRSLYILGVYMSSADHPQDVYNMYLDSIKHVISQLSSKDQVVILGDLNAHLRSRDSEANNHRCHMRNKVIENNSLINVSLTSLAKGPYVTPIAQARTLRLLTT